MLVRGRRAVFVSLRADRPPDPPAPPPEAGPGCFGYLTAFVAFVVAATTLFFGVAPMFIPASSPMPASTRWTLLLGGLAFNLTLAALLVWLGVRLILPRRENSAWTRLRDLASALRRPWHRD